MVNIIRCYKEAKKGYGPRKLNQGEMLNLQNLGRSFYLNSNQAKGSILKKKVNWSNPMCQSDSLCLERYFFYDLFLPTLLVNKYNHIAVCLFSRLPNFITILKTYFA